MGWLPDAFRHPEHVDLTTGHHLRPIRAADAEIDYPAVMGSRDRLWAQYGEAWGWPPATMTLEQDRDDLAHHEAEISRHEAFNYAILNADESELLGCVYIDPPPAADLDPPGADKPSGSDAVVSWWVVDRAVGTELDRELEAFVPRWLTDAWGFRAVAFSVISTV